MMLPSRLGARILIGLWCASFPNQSVRADAFDNYINPILARVAAMQGEGVKAIPKLTPELMAQSDRVFPGVNAAFLVVHTNEGRWCKLLVQAARQKVDDTATIPTLLIERYVTYKSGQERAVQVSGQNLTLFPDFRLNLDIGQVVPAQLGGDIRFVAQDGKSAVEPIGKAELFLITRPLEAAKPKRAERFDPSQVFEARFLSGRYKLFDDGRRSGILTLKVTDEGDVSGSYYSDKDGAKYEVIGKAGTPKHSIQFAIRFPKVEQQFQGWLFTGDGRALAGSSRMLERESGFYALRQEDE